MLETISLIVGVASGILTAIQSVKNLNELKRNKACLFLTEVALTLDEVVIKFKNNEVPHGACERMKNFALNMPKVLEGLLPQDQLVDYTNKLYYAHEIEMLYKDVMDDKSKLVELEKAAGMFHSAATIVKL